MVYHIGGLDILVKKRDVHHGSVVRHYHLLEGSGVLIWRKEDGISLRKRQHTFGGGVILPGRLKTRWYTAKGKWYTTEVK